MKTNLLIINQFASTPKYSTGAGERFYYLSRYFHKSGLRVKIISGGFNHLFLSFPKTPKLFNREEIPGGEIIWVKMSNYSGESFLGRFLSWFEFLFKLYRYRFNENTAPNIVVVSSMSIFPIFYALHLRKKFGTKVILEVRDIWPLTPVELGGYSRNNPFIGMMSFVEKYAYKKADKIVSVLPGFTRHVENTLGRKRDVAWIPNACNSEISSSKDLVGECHRLNKGYFNVLYAGALGLANAMEYIVMAAEMLKEKEDIRFVILGEGPDKLALIKQASNLPNVVFKPKVPKEELSAIISQADATIISWRDKKLYEYGVSANKYNDYMLASKPVISASNIIDDPVLLSGGGIQAEAENANSIADAVMKVYGMSIEERNAMGHHGRNFVLQHQTYKHISEKYLEVINNLRHSN